MRKINLRDVFPDYTLDCIIEISETDAEAFLACLTKEIADVYIAFERQNKNFNLRAYRNGAWYSLDLGDDIETESLYLVPSAENEYIAQQDRQALYSALASLPEKQARRIKAHYLLGLTKVEIARLEGVHERVVRTAISRGLNKMKKIINDVPILPKK